jgi:cytochrome c oxidase accessory protein FixG
MTEPLQLFAKQAKIYPKRVWGKFRKLKWVTMVLLLGIYYLTPWLRWDRGSHAPDQAILIDMAHTRAYFFSIEIWPQEVYYITGILILAAVGLFFVTSLFGRVWCGYACPQTVWTDLFVWVERIVQGDRNARKRLDEAPLSLEKIAKKGLTHGIWLIIGLLTGGAWVFYFNDAPTLMDQILHLNVPWSVGGWILGLTFSTYLMAGYAREQVCTYMCPYARFQSAMFDPDTLIIAYNAERGEPRGKHKAGDSWEGKGHCISCDSCVVVCPMGIDIREGLQMECIACGLCVDACDNVMEKIGLPKGLISYDTENKTPFKVLRPRSFWYGGIITLVGCFMLYTLLTRSPLEISVIHDRNPLFVTLSDGTIRNGYALSIINKAHEDRIFKINIKGLENDTLRIQSTTDIAADNLQVFADSVGHFRVFITAPKQHEAREEIEFRITDIESKVTNEAETLFMSETQ